MKPVREKKMPKRRKCLREEEMAKQAQNKEDDAAHVKKEDVAKEVCAKHVKKEDDAEEVCAEHVKKNDDADEIDVVGPLAAPVESDSYMPVPLAAPIALLPPGFREEDFD